MKYYQRVDLAFERKGDDIIIINHLTGEIITLNGTASALWELLKNKTSLKSLVVKITSIYQDPNLEEITTALQKFANEGLLKGSK